MERCWGSQCTNSSGFEKERRLICLWCDHPLVPKARLNESRRDYDSRHLFSNGSGLDVEGKIQTGPPRFGESPGSPGTVTRVQDDGAFTRNGRQRPSPTQQHLGHPFSSVQDGVELLNDMSEDPDSLKSNPSSSSTDSYEPVSSTGERPPAYSAVRMGE
ncbi:MAG: hypothetical protein M1827_006544 [Pycnora praestabilis]|nr:MAG: hypothetical protein M1827_006544 [Pycnora praestabilis]